MSLQRDKHLCSCYLKQCMGGKIHSYFSLGFCGLSLPTVLRGGQPGPCALELGFHQMHLDSSSVFMQKIPASTLLTGYMWCVAFEALFYNPSFDVLWYFSFFFLLVSLPVSLFPNLINISLMRPVILPYVDVWTSRTFIRLTSSARSHSL